MFSLGKHFFCAKRIQKAPFTSRQELLQNAMRRMPATAGGVAGPFDGEGSAHFFQKQQGQIYGELLG